MSSRNRRHYGRLRSGHATIQDIQPTIGVRAARLSARVTQVGSVLPSLAQEQPLRLAAAVRLVSSSQVFWRPVFWCPEVAARRA